MRDHQRDETVGDEYAGPPPEAILIAVGVKAVKWGCGLMVFGAAVLIVGAVVFIAMSYLWPTP